MTKKQRLGIIQSRGLGDLVIALPIARWYREHLGYEEIYWPICEEFISHMQPVAPWINWIPIKTDRGSFFYDVPLQRLRNFKCDEIVCLYQALTGHKFHEEPYFQHTKFDQYKYIQAGVPFLEKWRLADCITRNPEREQALYDRMVQNPNYVVVHLEGSDHTARWDATMVPADWQVLYISPETNCIWDWLKILEGAQSIVCVDSVYANIVDQLNIGDDRYFIARSHIGLTPVQGQHWTWLEP